MKKKIVCAAMCIAMAATSLVGCGSSADEGSTDTTNDNAANDAANVQISDDVADETGKVYYLNFKPEQADAWVDLASAYTDRSRGRCANGSIRNL